jgi:hypothetical protein
MVIPTTAATRSTRQTGPSHRIAQQGERGHADQHVGLDGGVADQTDDPLEQLRRVLLDQHAGPGDDHDHLGDQGEHRHNEWCAMPEAGRPALVHARSEATPDVMTLL